MRTLIIAEAGVNHNGDVTLAEQLVDAAQAAGADAVKFQTFKAENLVTPQAARAKYQEKNIGGNESQYEMLKRLELSFSDFVRLQKYCNKKEIQFLSTPFDEESAQFLIQELGMSYIKVPSGEVANLPFLKTLASFQKPMIVSTGMSDLQEVRSAVAAIQSVPKSGPVTLLHCTSNYPCPFEEVNLNAMQTLRETFHLPVGYSDHTMGIEIPIAAVALGAVVLEKHFTLDRALQGPDHACSLIPKELKEMVVAVRRVEQSLGSGEKKPTASELETRNLVRKSLVLTRSLSAGTLLTAKNFVSKRPGDGISPNDLEKIIGLPLAVDKKAGETLHWNDIQGGARAT